MNVLFVWTSKIRNAGGVGRVTETLGREFLKKGHQVAFLSTSPGDGYVEHGIHQYFCPSGKSPDADMNVQYITELLKTLETDVIINQTGTAIANLHALKIARSGDIKIYTVHHNCVRCMQEHHRLIVSENYRHKFYFRLMNNPFVFFAMKRLSKIRYGRYFRYCIENSDRLVLLSERYIRELKVYLRRFKQKKVVGIPNPVSFESEDDVEKLKENRILFVGRINFSQKKADLLIGLWEKLCYKYPDWEFDIVGDGPSLHELKQLAVNARLERIHFYGYQDPKPFFEKAKYFTMTSAYEGFPMVLTEALAFGVVPLAFDCFGALHEVVESGSNGVIIEPFNLESYSAELGKLMQNEEQRKKMAERGRISVQRFDAANVADLWMNLFTQTK